MTLRFWTWVALAREYTPTGNTAATLAMDTWMNRFVPAVLPLLWPAMIAGQATLRVTAFDDHNGNGTRDHGERPIPSVVISNQRDVATTDGSGIARVDRGPTGVVFVSVPNGYRNVGPFWRAPAPTDSQLTFALKPVPAPRAFTFVHASDTHIAPENVSWSSRPREGSRASSRPPRSLARTRRPMM